MACLSPSPSGRRLSELLEEQQEPFFLDLHLLEKGCSSSRLLLDGYDTALCWPAPANDAAAVLKRLTSSSSSSRGGKKQKQKQQSTGLLKLLLSKILHGKGGNNQKKPAALQFSDSFKLAAAAVAPAPPCCTVKTAAGETMAKKMERNECCCHSDSGSESSYSDDSDDEKQFSPVSVLEPHPFETRSPVHAKLSSPINAKLSPSRMDVIRDLLIDAAYSPALLTQLLAKSDDLVVAKDAADAEYEEEDDDEYYGYRSSPKNFSYDDAAYWEAHKAELARVSELVAGEVPNAKLDAAAVQPEREDVGAGVADAVLQALMQELVADLAGSC
ncbi:hypothetical protein PR202_gb13196 [Eleusine coracana subsp. coracana]|uniref:Uncharacterized protein n=1 Tax=Eleusine coracana subsp. coracana TaxID=191504 RepID=A0AAV5ET40_ELECO|nr:hypothetical protein QOZ80_9BG0711630 [Eleusine coracana subsp. coracana]GJN25375.1 hypothetical protein PR202_gb13196 [Eleusine coracana subsp. coracana]